MQKSFGGGGGREEYMMDNINKLETNRTKIIRHLYREIKESKKGYQLQSNLLKDENGIPLADSHSILNSWKNYFC
jgi:hypothetical protein